MPSKKISNPTDNEHVCMQNTAQPDDSNPVQQRAFHVDKASKQACLRVLSYNQLKKRVGIPKGTTLRLLPPHPYPQGTINENTQRKGGTTKSKSIVPTKGQVVRATIPTIPNGPGDPGPKASDYATYQPVIHPTS